ncbi:hypothetical protein TDB9533_00032 [Thalassocella blandensis]|nr:hypothetical protein TDB9533_00032 [Thalassocella blandensis]
MSNYFERPSSKSSSYSTYSHASDVKRADIRELLTLKQYDKESMMINNRLLSSIGCEFKVNNPLTNQDEPWHIRLSRAKSKGANTEQYLCLESESSQYWVSDGLKFLAHLTGIHLKKNQSSMINMLLPKIPAPIQEIFGWKLAYLAVPPQEAYLLDFHYGSKDVDLKVKLAVEKSTCLNLIHHKRFKSLQQKPLAKEITISSAISLGSINIGMLEASQLQIGDLIYLKETRFNANGSGVLPFGPFTLFAQIELVDNQYHLAINRWERNMTDETTLTDDDELISDDMDVSYSDDDDETQHMADGEESDADQLPVGDLPIKIDVRLGSIKFAVKDLHKIVEGKLYPINSPAKGSVQLMHNDMEIARGQLVEVDGKLAVEIQKHWVQV